MPDNLKQTIRIHCPHCGKMSSTTVRFELPDLIGSIKSAIAKVNERYLKNKRESYLSEVED